MGTISDMKKKNFWAATIVLSSSHLSGQTSMVKVTLELGQRRLGNRWGNVLLDAWAGLNVAYPLMGLRGTWLT